MNCPHCAKRLHHGLCMDRLCVFSITGGPDPNFDQLREELGEVVYFSVLDTFGFGHVHQIRSPKMRRVIGFVMRRYAASLRETGETAEQTLVGGRIR